MDYEISYYRYEGSFMNELFIAAGASALGGVIGGGVATWLFFRIYGKHLKAAGDL